MTPKSLKNHLNHVFLFFLIFISVNLHGKENFPQIPHSKQSTEIISNSLLEKSKLFATAFESGKISSLNKIFASNTPVTIIISHSISIEEKASKQILKSISETEQWIKKLQNQWPRPSGYLGLELNGSDCKKISCEFTRPIKHNHLFIKKIYFKKDENGQFWIQKIELIDGD